MLADAAARLEVRLRVARGDGDFRLDVELEVPPGITILFGPSGSGKTTTLTAIAGLTRPREGRIALGDEVWFDHRDGTDRPVDRRGVSFVFQSLALFPHLTAAGNVAYGIDRRVARAERRRRAREMLERMRVGHLADRRPHTYSGGEAQRVALARAFARAPRLVLLDEAFSSLDRDLRRALGTDARQMIEELGVPAIQVTHLREEARAMSDRMILLDRGRVVAVGATSEVLARVDASES